MRYPDYAVFSEEIRKSEKAAREESGSSFALMHRAAETLRDALLCEIPSVSRVLIAAGGGNNGGDGLELAAILTERGIGALCILPKDPSPGTEAAEALAHLTAAGGKTVREFPSPEALAGFDLLVDAVLGIGVRSPLREDAADFIRKINGAGLPVLSVDVPSGLNADSGAAPDGAVEAKWTVSLLGLHPGLFTGDGPLYAGKVIFDDLGTGTGKTPGDDPFSPLLLTYERVRDLIPQRPRTAYKGLSVRVAVIGGAPMYPGAAALASRGALRSGAGLVRCVAHEKSLPLIFAGCPEIMLGEADSDGISDALSFAGSVVLGPGLGRSEWSRGVYEQASGAEKPMVTDADGLFFLASDPSTNPKRVITPHEGEAARLLSMAFAGVHNSRFEAAEELQRIYGGVAVLKGPGTIIRSKDAQALCLEGNEGMATGGMGDLLSGIIGAFLASGRLSLFMAACLGVTIHSRAGDIAAADGKTGMLAEDLIPIVRRLASGIGG